MSLVVDASVALKWVLPEEGGAEAEALLRVPLHAPNLMLAECGNALWIAARRRLVSSDRAREALEFLASVPIAVSPVEPILVRALDWAFRLDHPLYDCLYIVLAQDLRMPLVTADRGLVAAARRARELDGVVASLVPER